jgi:hypothetical protein
MLGRAFSEEQMRAIVARADGLLHYLLLIARSAKSN